MEYPYCGTELRYEDYYGYYLGRDNWDKQGNIYICQNSFGFNTEEEAIEYAKENNIEYKDWQDIVCDSECFGGKFYTDKQENLHEGYPC